ncbi:NAD(P)-dependent alcohol dehydrogenase [Oceanicola sp. S124]|uniref:NAD(P)-dependent alcohol dehydrogenase n=1 Tax=Oceanicola sp. S124 TaxID=1042378 RepID=UPI0002557D9B|nr:NAD(P)-dependent alcohol dehydrogenase [Oceanicola sp. S124]
MKAIVYRDYGGPEVLSVAEIETPRPGPGEMLVKVEAAAVTTADWRLRAAAFPGILGPVGRAMFGWRRPRNPVLGSAFAGEVVAAGAGADIAAGPVLGFVPGGAHAEYLIVKPGQCVVARPYGLDAEAAAALPFGGLSALVFLRDVAKVTPGARVLVLGGSGEVGAMAVQVARAMGARVSAMASAPNLALLHELGAEEALDYRSQPVTGLGRRFDLVFDTFGACDLTQARQVLVRGGQFVPLNFGLREMLQALTNCLRARKLRLHVSTDRAGDLAELVAMQQAGQLRPLVGQSFPLDQVRAAHALVESRHKRGAVVLRMG